jgi:hypothetical protein
MTTGRLWRTIVSTSISEKPAAPSPSSSTTCDDGRGLIAAGKVTRVVVDVERFLDKASD